MSLTRPTLSCTSEDLNVSQAVRLAGMRGVDLRFEHRPSMIASPRRGGGVFKERLFPIAVFSRSLKACGQTISNVDSSNQGQLFRTYFDNDW